MLQTRAMTERAVSPSVSLAPVIVAGLVMIVWGATPVMTKLATAEMPPLVVAMLRTALGGLAALPILAVLRQPLPRGRTRLGFLVVSALAGFVVFPILYTIGQRETSAMHGGMILAALPIFTGTYAAMMERRRPSRRWLIGCALALTGEVALIAFRAGNAGTPASLFGDLLVLVSALLVATGYVAGARLAQIGYKSLAVTLWGIALAAFVALPIAAALFAADGPPMAGWQAWSAVLFLALITSIVGYVGWYWALAKGGIARIATIQFFQPISGLILAAILLGEQLTLPLAAASAVILAGVYLAQRR
jgi:drug/metabolite transporter (DMT)-like permease